MANTAQLQNALQKPYDTILFGKDVLSQVFGSGFILNASLVPVIVQPNQSEQVVINSVFIYGNINLEDGTEITCYEVVLQPTVRIEHSKVAIQYYVRKLLTAGQMAIINFIPTELDKSGNLKKGTKVWRLTLVAKDSELKDEGIKEKVTHAKRYTYLLGPSETCKTPAHRLERLSIESRITFQKVREAFEVEKLSDEFFEEYTRHYEKFCEYLQESNFKRSVFKISITKDASDEEKDIAFKPIRDFVKKLLGRVVFLYFVQKKGWLGASDINYKDGLTNFIKELFHQSGGNDSFYSNWLTVLFFDTLNKERPADDFKMPNGKKIKVPFLNGGLFDKEEFDEALLTIPARLFHNKDFEDVILDKKNPVNSRGFFDFLDSFNFTVYEDGPNDHTVAVDPEMLGHIFENLLEDNKDKGTFYTPKEIVHYMCQESLTQYLAKHLELESEESNTSLRLLVKDKEVDGAIMSQLGRIEEFLDSVKICDPAIGSGAFPMGLLQEIHGVKEVIAFELQHEWRPAEVKENIIQNSIYGVDIEKGAVDIARLRFWLSLVVDEDKPRPLPNLDYKIVVGNSLVGKFEGEIIEIDWERKQHTASSKAEVEGIQELLKQIAEKQKTFFKPSTKNKRKLQGEIRDLKLELLIKQLSLNRKVYESKNPVVLDSGFGLNAKDRTKNGEIASQRESFEKNLSRLEKLKKDKDSTFDHFDWQLDFPEILNSNLVSTEAKKGFDILIGNPPYLRVQGIRNNAPDDVEHYIEKYDSATGRFDLFVLFTECGFKLLNEKGVLNFIQPDKWINSDFGRGLRKLLSKNLRQIISFGQSQVFNVSTYSSIIWISKEKLDQLKYHKIDIELKGEREIGIYLATLDETSYADIDNSSLGEDPWVLASNETALVLNQLSQMQSKLSDLFSSVSQGVVSVGDDIFILEGKIKGKLFEGYSLKTKELITIESALVKPMLRGDEIRRYSSLTNAEYIIYPHYLKNGKTIPYSEQEMNSQFPKGYNYLLKFKDELVKKKIKYKTNPKYWYSLHRAREISLFSQPKLVTPEISLGSNFTLDEENFFHNTQVYSLIKKKDVKIDLKVFLTILNSNLAWYYLKSTGAILRGGYFRFKTNYLEPFPMPSSISNMAIDCLTKLASYQLVQYSQNLEHSNEKLVRAYFDQIINGVVYELYFPELLNKNERSIIRHLKDLPKLNEDMTSEAKLKICNQTFERLNDREHPVRVNLFYMSSIPEIAIIEGKHENN